MQRVLVQLGCSSTATIAATVSDIHAFCAAQPLPCGSARPPLNAQTQRLRHKLHLDRKTSEGLTVDVERKHVAR